MNDDYRELKARIRKLNEILVEQGRGHLPFAQALSAVHRAERDGDRSRKPTPQLTSLLEKAESLSRNLASS